MDSSGKDEFYVGYQSAAPAGLARFVRRWVVATFILAAVGAITLVLSQGRFVPAFFEFGNSRNFEGFVSEHPYPTLLLPRPEAGDSAIPFSRYLLTTFGKFGAAEALQGLDGQHVRLSGTLVYRDDQTMIEIAAGSVQPLTGHSAQPPSEARASIGQFTLAGEIVDSKCYLGVMKPGNLKPHRSCAVRCISGGIPPIFVTRDASGTTLHLLMVGADDRNLNKEVLDYVADPIVLRGEVVRDGALLLLRTEPDSFRRAHRGETG